MKNNMEKQSNKSKQYNKGEWGESYALSCILRDRSIPLCNHKLDVTNTQIPIISVQFKTGSKHFTYIFDDKRQEWKLKNNENKRFTRLSIKQASSISSTLEQALRTSSYKFDNKFLNLIKKIGLYPSSKASQTKTDIILKIRDIKCGYDVELGYSIKSFLGSNPPTLFNASGKNTVYKFKITGIRLPKFKQIMDKAVEMHNDENVSDWFVQTVKLLIDNKVYFDPIYDSPETLSFNLEYIDLIMQKILSNLIRIHNTERVSSVEDAVKILKSSNPLRLQNINLYEYKVKKFLVASAFGMTAAKQWDGTEQANGGFIIVTPEYRLLIYQPYNRNNLENYLYKACKFDRPKMNSKSNTGLHIEGRNKIIDFAFQIRFKSFAAIKKSLQTLP